jgi:hypothetical protein
MCAENVIGPLNHEGNGTVSVLGTSPSQSLVRSQRFGKLVGAR